MASQTFQYAYVVTSGAGTSTVTVDPPSGPASFQITERADDGDGINGSTAFGFDVDFSSNGGSAIQLGFVALSDAGDPILFASGQSILYSNNPSLGPTIDLTTPAIFTYCFAQDTQIATDRGDISVQSLAIDDMVTTAEGRHVSIKWIGRQTVQNLFSGERMQPVRIQAGALGNGLPQSDLTVTADHGMIVDGVVINASALVNGTTIDWLPMNELPDEVTYYHIETEAHDVILANGAPAETFIDVAGRQAFDNHQEYLDLYGAERIIPEMRAHRITSQRLLPQSIKARLGITDAVHDMALIA